MGVSEQAGEAGRGKDRVGATDTVAAADVVVGEVSGGPEGQRLGASPDTTPKNGLQ